jgi:hypothetical protein
MADLATRESNADFGFWGVVKETGVDDEGLTEFYERYYKFPLYRDSGLSTFKAFGDKTIFSDMSWNPFRLYRGMKQVSKRMKDKKIDGNMVGEGLKKGEIFILNPDGEVLYALEEETGSPLDLDAMQAAMDAITRNQTPSMVTPEL